MMLNHRSGLTYKKQGCFYSAAAAGLIIWWGVKPDLVDAAGNLN